jgi:hypothetical protein
LDSRASSYEPAQASKQLAAVIVPLLDELETFATVG